MPTISPEAAAKLPEMLKNLREMNRKLDAILAKVEAKPVPDRGAALTR